MAGVLIASDKFKGTMTAAEVARALGAGLRRARPELEVRSVPVADGGDGTVEAAVAAGFELVPVTASGPTGDPVLTAYARRGEVAVVELADVSGLGRLVDGPMPMVASSRGTGEVVAAAVDDGCTGIVLGIGGSACTDGGSGMLAALGARILDAAGHVLPDGGGALDRVDRIDLAPVARRLAEVQVTVACDVDNPLTGSRGAAAVYGPQKGATPAQVAVLDRALGRWADVLAAETTLDGRELTGAGAAGGVGFAALAGLGAELRPGIGLVLDLVGFERALEGVELVVTGEGALDSQTLHGKAPAGVAAAARRSGVPVVAICGTNRLGPQELAAAGIDAVHALVDIEPDLGRCLRHAEALLARLGERVAHAHLRLPAGLVESCTPDRNGPDRTSNGGCVDG